MTEGKYLKRYTNVYSVMNMLRSKNLSLTKPVGWDDLTDKKMLDLFKIHSHAKSVLALCFTGVKETFHHWRVFAPDEFGACVSFDKQKLTRAFPRDIIKGEVKYVSQRPNKDELMEINPKNIPFLKRKSYSDEREFRLVYLSSNKIVFSHNIKFDIKSIDKISLSPWLTRLKFEEFKEEIHKIPGCRNIKVHHSRLLRNDIWSNSIKKALDHKITT